MSFPTVVFFHWGEAYRVPALRLADQCEAFGYAYRMVSPNLEDHFARCPGEWKPRRWACRYVPTFLLRELRRPKPSLDAEPLNLLYLHADFQIRKLIPDVFAGLDVGLQDRWAWKPKTSRLPMYAAPIFVRNNDRARRFLTVWEALCLNVDDGNFEHGHLNRAYEIMRRDRSLRIGYFPEHIASVSATANCAIRGHKEATA